MQATPPNPVPTWRPVLQVVDTLFEHGPNGSMLAFADMSPSHPTAPHRTCTRTLVAVDVFQSMAARLLCKRPPPKPHAHIAPPYPTALHHTCTRTLVAGDVFQSEPRMAML